MDAAQIADLGLFVGGVIALTYYIIIPSGKYIAGYIERTTNRFFIKMDDITKSITNEHRITREAMQLNGLTDEQIINIGFTFMRNASFEKLEYLDKVLVRNDIINRRAQIEHNIRNTLTSISEDEYLTELNAYTFSTGDKLGDWIGNNFPMDDFIKKLYKIFFREGQMEANDHTIRHRKITDIKILMFMEQTKLRKKCKEQIINKT